MNTELDISGLREQIKENAARVFPAVVSQYYYAYKITKRESGGAFDIFTIYKGHGVGMMGHCAILSGVVDGKDRDLAVGNYSRSVQDALLSLLEVLGETIRVLRGSGEDRYKKSQKVEVAWVDTVVMGFLKF